MKRVGARFKESMKVIEGMWTQDTFSFKGKFYEFDNVCLTPKPYQRPRPPVWIGAFANRAIERSLDWDGWVWWFPSEIESAAQKIEYWREQAYKKGKKNWCIALAYEGWVGDDENQLRKSHGHRWVSEAQVYRQRGLDPDMRDVPLEQLENQYLILGPAQKWVDRLGEVQERLKPNVVCIRTRNPRPPSGDFPDNAEFLECITRRGRSRSSFSERPPFGRWEPLRERSRCIRGS